MSLWSQHEFTDKVVQILTDVHCINEVHHFGRPYISAYQLAIEMQRQFPGTVAGLGKPIGGAGTGQHDSLAQYLSNETLQADQGTGRRPSRRGSVPLERERRIHQLHCC